MEEGKSQSCDDSEVQKAIINYQKTYSLPPTGKLDEKTKKFMSTSRCGNKDDEEKASSTSEPNNQPNVSPSKSSDSNGRGKRRKRDADRGKLFTVITGQYGGQNSARTVDHHRQYVDNYIRNLKSTEKRSLRRKLLHKYTPKERRKRSVHVWSTGSLPLGKSMDNGEMFNKKVVYWRLLNTGYSNRIPMEDQRATIDLAFRMWSEVIPLKFAEDSNSDIMNVDIEIAFGKGKSH